MAGLAKELAKTFEGCLARAGHFIPAAEAIDGYSCSFRYLFHCNSLRYLAFAFALMLFNAF